MSNIPVWQIQDYNGNVDANKLVEALASAKLTLYGMDLPAILALRHDYLRRNGRMPITKESVAALALAEGREPAPRSA